MSAEGRARLVAVRVDEASLAPATPEHEHERAIAIYDLLERNSFAVVGHEGGPYALTLSEREGKLALSITEAPARAGGAAGAAAGTSTPSPDEGVAADGAPPPTLVHVLSLSPLRRVMRDYFLVCESYYAAIRTASPSQIEAIDMGRRGLHDEAAAILRERLDGKIAMDFETARQLFTLICALRARA